MMRNSFKIAAIALVTALAASSGAFADPNQPPPPMKDPARKAAHQACETSAPKDPSGHPDHKAMHACMESKGFQPKHHHSDKDNAPALPGQDHSNGAPPPPGQ